jgi:Na+:H+ antiporter, NhaA family
MSDKSPHNQESSPLFMRTFREFAKLEAAGGILLLIFTAVALIWANSPWASSYFNLWQTRLTVGLGSFVLDKPLLLWINDGLMAMFFFTVGLEIKREILVGELSSPKKAALPIAAAMGGMIVPALFYIAINVGKPGAAGWGIPMATDIAFALGIMALVGKRVPVALKLFLTSLAIVDDLGAVLVIAFFYTSKIVWFELLVGAVFLVALLAANRAGVRNPLFYALLGIGGLWLSFLLSGVHATIAGVLAAMTIPVRSSVSKEEFLERGRYFIEDFEESSTHGMNILTNKQQREAAESLESVSELVQTPLQRLEHALHPWVTFIVMPIFAFANAGVSFSNVGLFQSLTSTVGLGIIIGLVIGKQIGITLFSWVAVRIGLATMPTGVTWRQIYGVGWLGGIGFTMSIFIASLAFRGTQFLFMAKLAILTASLIAGILGFIILRSARPQEVNES